MEAQEELAKSNMHMWEEEQPKAPKRKREEIDHEKILDELVDEPNTQTLSSECAPREKKQLTENDSSKAKDEENIAFFQSRVDDFKLYMSRRIPPDNKVAQAKLAELLAATYADLAKELGGKIASMESWGALCLAFPKTCEAFQMKPEDFFDRSAVRSRTEDERLSVWQADIKSFNRQLSQLVKLGKELPPRFWEALENTEESS